METPNADSSPTIVSLAGRIQEDIAQKQLGPGDPYLKLAETARMLGVSNGSANRALQLLEQRGVLSRRQRKGTFISSAPNRVSSGGGV
ncbi:MAG: GntR family transcriptional regulator, partial [Blastopirellula sp. JB062]